MSSAPRIRSVIALGAVLAGACSKAAPSDGGSQARAGATGQSGAPTNGGGSAGIGGGAGASNGGATANGAAGALAEGGAPSSAAGSAGVSGGAQLEGGGAGAGGSTTQLPDPPLQPGSATGYPYVSDLADGTYRNPVLVADYSDPDPIRIGSDYYLVASSFNVTPGLPILHSKDLVNWTIVGHALDRVPGDRFSLPVHGQGVWAPSIRQHAGTLFIVFPVYCKPPDDGACAEEGIWVVTASQATGPWSAPHQLLAARGVIDPCLFWDDDGKAYLVHAYANSRAGISDRVDIRPMSVDATQTLGTGQMVFSEPQTYPTLEGPKMYKRNGYYYILAPAGGVVNGYQVALRSQAVYGPYEARVVLEQGSTTINGPHQGGLVDTPDGSEWWFLHFQDAGPYGRILHLNPVTWQADWPLMGVAGANGIRQPVTSYKKPTLPVQPIQIPQTSDDFAAASLGLQWQWHANAEATWFSLSAQPGSLRLFPESVPAGDLTQAPNLLMQKVPARSFNAATTVQLSGTQAGTRAGLVVWGDPATALTVETAAGGLKVSLISGGTLLASDTVASGAVRLQVAFSTSAICRFSYGPSSGALKAFSPSVTMAARKNSWIGVKVGVFALAADQPAPAGYADFDGFTFSPYAAP